MKIDEVLAIEDKVHKQPVETIRVQPMSTSTNATSASHTTVKIVGNNSVETRMSRVHSSSSINNTSNKRRRGY